MNVLKLGVILLAGALLVILIKNYNLVTIRRGFYVFCPDGTIVPSDAHFCSNREALACEGRICELTTKSPLYWLYR